MKAIVYSRYGSPEVLKVREVETPEIGDNEVLVKVRAAAANPADWHMIRGKPLVARLGFGLFKPKHTIPGMDIAGVIEKTGKDVTEFVPGDEVFGGSGWGGAFAEYAAVAEDDLVFKPGNVTFEEAAAVNVAGITALQGLRHKREIKPGQKVLINGASGGVGTYAVQIAKTYGAEVTGVCSTKNLEFVRKLGADYTIDYTSRDFTRLEEKYDFILDAVGNRTVTDYMRALTPNGICVIVGFTTLGRLTGHMVMGAIKSSARGKTVSVMGTATTGKKDLNTLRELLESGKVNSVIDKKYKLEKTAGAIDYLEQGHARGKVVITVG